MKLDELARLAGVSRTTVSYVVNGKARQYRVSHKTIAKVEALIKQYDFKPNAMAAGLRAGKSNTIGLIIPDFENISYAKIANQLEQRFRKNGYQLLMACSDDDAENEMACAKHLVQRRIDALMVSTSLPEAANFYQRYRLPIIGFDRQIQAENILNVRTDDKGDAQRLAQQLFARKSYRRVLFFGALPGLFISREREGGFRAALKVRSVSAEFLYARQFRSDNAAQVFARWLAENPLPEAIFVTSLTLLQGVIQVLLRRPEGIPKTLDIATFGDSEMLALLPNRVICCAQNYGKVADALMELVLGRLENKKVGKKPRMIRRDIVERCGA